MRKIRFLLTIWICKLCGVACRLTGRKGSSAPGLLALRLYPQILKELSGRVRGKTVAICGTNGKTTTNNLLYSFLSDKGAKTVCNNIGSNMISGVAAAYIRRCDVFGRFEADWACLEIDEAFALKILDQIKPDYMLITNLFSDQSDRYGEIEATADLLKKAIEKTPETVLILNGDDPLCAGLQRALGRKSFFFGIDGEPCIPREETRGSRFCAGCRHELKYNYYQYGHLGDYYCENCDFCRPAPDFAARGIKTPEQSEFTFGDIQITANLKGLYNVYNIIAALSAAALSGAGLENVNSVLAAYEPQIGRMEKFTLRGIPAVLNLAKNTVSFNLAVSAMLNDPREKNVLIILNDCPQDGRDVS